MKVYLSGPISEHDREGTDQWRAQASQFLHKEGIDTIDPCRRKVYYNPQKFTPNEIVIRDLRDVEEADLVLLNYRLLPGHLPIGSPCEMVYAWDRKKPVVVVAEDSRIQNHPWVLAMAVRIFPTLEEALEYIVTFWGRA